MTTCSNTGYCTGDSWQSSLTVYQASLTVHQSPVSVRASLTVCFIDLAHSKKEPTTSWTRWCFGREWLSLIFMTVCWCNGEGRSRFAGQMVVNHQNIADGCIYIIYIYVLGLHWTRNLCLYQLSESSMMDGLKPYRILWGVEAMTYICHHTGYMYVYLCTPNILGYT